MAEDFQNIKWREISKSHFRGSWEVVMNLRQTIFIKYFLKKNYYFAVSGETKTGLPFNIPKMRTVYHLPPPIRPYTQKFFFANR